MMAGIPLGELDSEHREALEWFASRTGQDIGWPAPIDGLFLLNKAKGIHKPKGWRYALSVRQSLDSPYADSDPAVLKDGDWSYRYFQEGQDPASRDKDFTNKALMRNLEDGVPVAVVRQVKRKPNVRYHVLGLARVADWKDGYFELRRYEPEDVGGALPAPPASLEDARRRIKRAIVARQGAGPFRASALAAFSGRCAISGYDVEQGLEAAHIVPYLGEHTNALANTLLLRADLHTLLDRSLLEIDPETLRIHLAPALDGTCLGSLAGTQVKLPGDPAPWQENLRQRAKLLASKDKNA